ncbi:glycosyltransferase [Dysgonomonas sp. 521]|uniref:glycosyltransferase family 2 protein n=1 Tax=Dysgonomonas sp. 521 TaxID=2302932 RepID=UPI0013D270CE|nr:glycosyltransferase family 2 protein [Dysgonomonas sp. 521]NDV93867.1 glycosyltransferase [Dysgonomonas sp. 521]
MKVSICIPAYKHIDFLRRCLDSVLEQEFTDYEIIITDDSPDNSLQEFIDRYSDSRIKYFRNGKALGSPLNWNEGIKKAAGEYIKILHHDDWFTSPKSLGKFVKLLDENPQADIAFSASCDIDSNNKQKVHIAGNAFLENVAKEAESIYLGNRFGAPSVCIFRNKGYSFDTNLIWLVDIDFYIRLIAAGNNTFGITQEILVNIGVSEFQITQQCLTESKVRISEKIYLYNKYYLEKKSSKYRKSLLRYMGREGIVNTSGLKKVLPDAGFTFTATDSLRAYIYYIKRRIRNFLPR